MPETGHYGTVRRIGAFEVSKHQGSVWDYYSVRGNGFYSETSTTDGAGMHIRDRRPDGAPRQKWTPQPKDELPLYIGRYVERLCVRFNRGEDI